MSPCVFSTFPASGLAIEDSAGVVLAIDHALQMWQSITRLDLSVDWPTHC